MTRELSDRTASTLTVLREQDRDAARSLPRSRHLSPRIETRRASVPTAYASDSDSEVSFGTMGPKVMLLVMYLGLALADKKPTITEKIISDSDLSEVNFKSFN